MSLTPLIALTLWNLITNVIHIRLLKEIKEDLLILNSKKQRPKNPTKPAAVIPPVEDPFKNIKFPNSSDKK